MNRTIPLQPLSNHSSQRDSSSQQQTFRALPVAQVASRFLPPQLLVLLSMLSVQLGAAYAKSLFPVIGSTGTVFLRLTFAALLLLVIWRPRLHGYTRKDYLLLAVYGICVAGMNMFFYASIARIP